MQSIRHDLILTCPLMLFLKFAPALFISVPAHEATNEYLGTAGEEKSKIWELPELQTHIRSYLNIMLGLNIKLNCLSATLYQMWALFSGKVREIVKPMTLWITVNVSKSVVTVICCTFYNWNGVLYNWMHLFFKINCDLHELRCFSEHLDW